MGQAVSYLNYKYSYNNCQLHKKLIYNLSIQEQLYLPDAVEETFYFNAVGNLDSIVRQNVVIDQNLNVTNSQGNYKNRIVKIYLEYDNTPNIFKKLRLKEDFFDRSLSKNNPIKIRGNGYVNNKIDRYWSNSILYKYSNKHIDLMQ